MVSIEKMIHRATNHLIAFHPEKYYVFETPRNSRSQICHAVVSGGTVFYSCVIEMSPKHRIEAGATFSVM